MPFAALFLLIQIAVPQPRGYVNDFANVVDSAWITQIDAAIREVRQKTGGDIAVVTMSDIGDRSVAELAVRIGREWGVGGSGEAGDPARNLGVVIVLVPLRDHAPGTGQIFIATGRGAEGFLPDARIGRIRDAIVPYLAREAYGEGLAVGVALLAQAFAAEFNVRLDSIAASPPTGGAPRTNGLPIPLAALVLMAILFMLATRRRRRRSWWWALPLVLGRGGFRGGGGIGRGGFGGGGFGGFGGGGGFSGGGAGGRF